MEKPSIGNLCRIGTNFQRPATRWRSETSYSRLSIADDADEAPTSSKNSFGQRRGPALHDHEGSPGGDLRPGLRKTRTGPTRHTSNRTWHSTTSAPSSTSSSSAPAARNGSGLAPCRSRSSWLWSSGCRWRPTRPRTFRAHYPVTSRSVVDGHSDDRIHVMTIGQPLDRRHPGTVHLRCMDHRFRCHRGSDWR
jgi:hypothetical protein